MVGMALELPKATVDVLPNGLGIITSPPDQVHVVMGCCSKGPVTNPYQPYALGSLAGLTGNFGCGPAVKAAAYTFAKTQAPFIFIRVPATAITAAKSAVDKSGVAGTLVPTVTGTPNDEYNIVFVFTVAGTIGVAGIFYKWSKDGGQTFTTPAALGVATTVTLTGTGLTANFTGAQTVLLNDTFTLTTVAPAPAILPQAVTRADASTATLVASGTPEDEYDFLLEVLTGGTVGSFGIVYRYSLDGGRTFTASKQLGTDISIQILDGEEDSGIDIAVGAGTLDDGDTLEFRTTAPQAQSSDIQAALDLLRTSAHRYSFIRYVGVSTPTKAGDIGNKMASFASSGKYTWTAGETRLKSRYESALAWRQDLIDDFVLFADDRIALSAGGARITCPITKRQNVRPVMWVVTPRLIQRPMQEDPGRKATGALSSDIKIHDDNNVLFEHDARVEPSLHAARFVTLRTYDDEAGVYITRGNMMSAEDSDFSRIALRRVMDVASLVFKKAMEKQLVNHIRVNAPGKPNAGFIREIDARKIEREFLSSLEDALITTGRASSVSVQLSRTDPVLTNGGKLTCKVRVTPLGYIDQFEGDIAFENPALAALQAA